MTKELENLARILRDPLSGLTWENRTAAASAIDNLLTARAEASAAVKVKALEWKQRNDIPGLHSALGCDGWLRNIRRNKQGRFEYEGDPATTSYNETKFFNTLNEAKAAAQSDYERCVLSCITTEPAAPADTETRRGKSREDLHKHEPDHEPDFLAGEQSGETSPGAPEGRQEAVALTYSQKLIAEAISSHFGERGENYDEYEGDTTVDDVWDAFDDLTRPSEQAVTEAMVETAQRKYREIGERCNWQHSWPSDDAMREILKAAMEAGRHD